MRLHIPKHEGGHLIIVPKRVIPERSMLTVTECIEIHLYSVVGGVILRKLFGASWINYQENGNWSLGLNSPQHLHLHIYGRCKVSETQPYGEALRFPLRNQLDSFGFAGYTDEEIIKCRNMANSILDETWADTYRQTLKGLKTS